MIEDWTDYVADWPERQKKLSEVEKNAGFD